MNANEILFICLIITELFNVIIIRKIIDDIRNINKQ